MNEPQDVVDRYQRQRLIPGWGAAGQKKIAAATVCIIGAGGLGCPVAQQLTLAGVGALRLCDPGRVMLTNLNRQFLYTLQDLEQNKATLAKAALARLNPQPRITAFDQPLNEHTADAIVGESDLIIDCLDNFPTRHLLNRVAVTRRIPLIHAGIEAFAGQVTFLAPPQTPCLYCIFPGSPPARAIFPAAGVNASLIGTIQAAEALKYLTGIGPSLTGRLLYCDARTMEFTAVPVAAAPDCPVCGMTHET